MPAADTHRAIDAVFRIEQAKLIAGLARMVRDVGVAEELAQDALVLALEQWPKAGIPDKPGAWLMAAAKHRAIDRFRRAKLAQRKHEELGREIEGEGAAPDLDAALDDDIGDDLLRLVFTACHPVLSTESRVALTLRLIGGLTTEEIARAFLVPEPTIAQRIVRAKRTLTEKRVPFEVPPGEERAERLPSHVEWVFPIFNEGYSAGFDQVEIRRCQRNKPCLRQPRTNRQIVRQQAENLVRHHHRPTWCAIGLGQPCLHGTAGGIEGLPIAHAVLQSYGRWRDRRVNRVAAFEPRSDHPAVGAAAQ